MKIFARFWIGYTIFLLGGGLLIIALGDFSFGIKYVLGGLVMLGLYLWVKIDNKKAKEKAQKEQEVRAEKEKLEQVKRQEQIAELNQMVKDGNRAYFHCYHHNNP